VPTKRDRVYFPVTPDILELLEEWAATETRTVPNLCEREISAAAKRWKASREHPTIVEAIEIIKSKVGTNADTETTQAIAALEKGLTD